jgi:uncharacterized protein (TIGR02996 family)
VTFRAARNAPKKGESLVTEADWLRQIADDHKNDALRLMFADWLEEHGDAARAEFIRVQVGMETARSEKVRWAMIERQHLLLTEHRDAWLAEMPKTVRTSCTFERGFVVRLRCTASQWLRNAKRIHQAHPLLEGLDLHSFRGKHIQQLAASPLLARLTTLSLSNQVMGKW